MSQGYKKIVLFAIVFVTSYCLFAIKFNHYYTPDSIFYISVAEHLIKGDLFTSINGYWSPLVSWLLVPLMFIFKGGITSFKILNFILSIFILLNIYKILNFYKIKERLKTIATLCFCLLIPMYSVLYLTADILIATLLSYYYYKLLTDKLYSKPILYSAIGFALYLSKAYGLYFFAAHSIFYFILKKDERPELMNFLKGIALFIILCSVWISVLSVKYNSFTISTASRYNQSIITKNHILFHPCDTLQIIPPTSSELYSAWEEMSLHIKNKPTNINNAVTLQNIWHNSVKLYEQFYATPRYGIWLFILLLLPLLFQRKLNKTIILPLSLAVIYSAGYLIFFIEERYIIFSTIVFIILQAIMLNKYSMKYYELFLTLFLVYSISRSVMDTYLYFTKTDEEISYKISVQTEKYWGGKNFVTYLPYQFATLSYMNKWKNYSGIKNYNKDSMLLENDLTKYKIDFIIFPDTVSLPENIKSQYSNLQLTNIGIYQLWKRN